MKVAQSRPTLWDPTDYRVHGILHARILEWVANPFSRGSSQPRNWTRVSCIAGGFFTSWATSSVQFSSVQSLSRVRLFVTPWIASTQASLSITTSWSLLNSCPIESVMPFSHLILCRPPSPPALKPSQHQGLFQQVNSSHEVASFSFSISLSNEHPGLISFRMDRLDLLAVQGTLKSLLQHHSSKASIFRHSAFLTGKPINKLKEK